MNPISKAMDEIKFRIPAQILDLVFGYKGYGFAQAPISLDESMMNLVIRPRVLVDADLVGGMMVIVPLDGIIPEWIDNYSLVYKIPDARVMNRTIISVLSVGYMPYSNGFNSMGTSYGNIAPTSINDVASINQRLADSYSSVPPISNAVVDLIGHNTVVIRDQYRVSAAYQLRCIVGNEQNLNNINPRSYHMFAKLCELAIKSYIYNTLIVKIDQGYLQGGQELGIVKTIVENLADSEENYQTYLREKWRKAAFMNDVMSYDRLIKLQVNPAI
jgi:hypothetical protein